MKIIIIGGTAAGMSAAVKAKKLAADAEITVYEKTDIVSLGACGLPYYVADYFQDTDRLIARSKEAFDKQGIKVEIRRKVTAADTEKKTVAVTNLETGETFTDHYDQLMIATGASPILPPVNRTDFKNLFTMKTMADGMNLKNYLKENEVAQVTIVGGGFIGVELAEAMLHQGKKVQLIQLDPHIMTDSFDSDISVLLEEKMLEKGVDLKLSEAVEAFSGEEKITEVITNKGSYKTDLVVAAIGVRPNTQFLGDHFRKLGNGALIVDETGRTNVSDVFAAGDCATVKHIVTGDDVYIPLATGANKLGRIAGENMAGLDTAYPGSLGTAGVKFTELEAARTGLTEEMAKKLGISYKTVVINDKNQTDYYPDQKDIRVKLVYDPESRVILGGQVTGENGAALRVDVLAQAIAAKQTTKDLGMLDLLYAPPFARTWDVLNVAGNVAK